MACGHKIVVQDGLVYINGVPFNGSPPQIDQEPVEEDPPPKDYLCPPNTPLLSLNFKAFWNVDLVNNININFMLRIETRLKQAKFHWTS